MTLWRPDPTFYPSPRMAMEAPREKFGYVASFNPTAGTPNDSGKPDAINVIDLDPDSPTYTKLATSGSFTPGADGVSYNFTIIATLMGTTASGVVGGNQYVIINNTIQTSLAALTNSLTGIVFGQSGSGSNQVQSGLGGAPFGLVVGITFGSSFSTNAASLNEFVIEA